MTERFYLPGGDGKWGNPPLPETLEDARQRIRVLEAALYFYSDGRSYNPKSRDNEFPSYEELMVDRGLRARIGRLAMFWQEFCNWILWASQNKRSS